MTDVVWSADGRRVLAAVHGGTVMTWQVATRKSNVVMEGSDHFKDVAATVAAASPRFAAAFEDTDGKVVVKVWDEVGNVRFTSTSAPTGPYASSQGFRKVELSRDGTRLACFGSDSNRVDSEQVGGEQKEVGRLRVWDVAGGQGSVPSRLPGACSSTTRPSVPMVAGWPRHRGRFAAHVRTTITGSLYGISKPAGSSCTWRCLS